MAGSKTFDGIISAFLSFVLAVGLAPLPLQRAYGDELQAAPGASLGEQATVTVTIVNNLTMKKGKTRSLSIDQGSDSDKKWYSSNTSVATVKTVNGKGVVTAKKAGQTIVYVRFLSTDKRYGVRLTVLGPKKVSLSKKTLSLAKGKTATLKLKNATAKKVKWSTSNKKVATVTSKGVVKAKQVGSAKIVAKYGGKKYACAVTVKAPVVKVKKTRNGTVTVKLKKNKATTVGTLKKDGYQVVIPAGALPAGTKVKVAVKDGRIDLTAVGKKHVRLSKMATVKLALTGKVDPTQADNWWGVYRYAGVTHLIEPDMKQLLKGVASYRVGYFTQSGGKLQAQGAGLQTQDVASWFGFKKVTDKERRAAAAYRYAVNEITADSQNESVQAIVEDCFGAAADALGFKEGDPGRDKFMKQLGKTSDLVALVRAAKSGDEAAFTGKATEIMTKVIVENADGTKVGYLGAAAGSIPGVLQKVKNGDYAGASRLVGEAVSSNVPYVKMVKFTAAVTEATVDYYVDEEMEAAYKEYYKQLKNGAFGYESASSVSWSMVSRQMAAPLRELEMRAYRTYAEGHQKSVGSLTAQEKAKVRAAVKDTILRQWNYRAAREAKIEARQNEVLELIKWFDEVGLMTRGDMSVSFHELDDYQARILNLLHVYDAVKDMMGGKTFAEISGTGENWLGGKQAVRDYNNENMAKLVLMWVKNGWGSGKNPAKGRLAVAKHLAYSYGVGVRLSSKTLSLEIGRNKKLALKGVYGKVSWGSSNAQVAKVGTDGTVKALKAGSATIYASYGKKSFECKLTVKKKQPRTVYVPGSQTVEFETGGSNGIIICRVGAGYNDSFEDGWYFGVNKAGTQKVSVMFNHPTKGYTKYVFTLVGKAETPAPGSSVVYAIGAARFNLDTETWA